jgi:PhnB protein
VSDAKNKLTVFPYLMFSGRCEEAIAFYEKAIGAKLEYKMHFNESPEPPPPGQLAPGFEKKVMHAQFNVAGNTIMCSDGCDADSGSFNGFQLAVSVPTIAEADKIFAGLAEGGKVNMPQAATFWSPRFGMLTDKFGVDWMVMVPGEGPPKQ